MLLLVIVPLNGIPVNCIDKKKLCKDAHYEEIVTTILIFIINVMITNVIMI